MSKYQQEGTSKVVPVEELEKEAWKLLLESGKESIIEMVIQNNIKNASDLKEADPAMLTQILSKYKELKTNKEYEQLKAKFDGFLVEKGYVTSATMEIIETIGGVLG